MNTNIDFLSVGYGGMEEDNSIRMLNLKSIQQSCDIGFLRYNIRAKCITGKLWNLKLEANIQDEKNIHINDDIESFSLLANFKERYLSIIRGDGHKLMITWAESIEQRFRRIAFYRRDGFLYELNISRNHTPLDFFKAVFSLLSFGWYVPQKKGILTNNCRELPNDEQKMLLYGALMLQFFYFPADYDAYGWS